MAVKWYNSTFIECEGNHGFAITPFYIRIPRNSLTENCFINQCIMTPTALGFVSKLMKMGTKPR